MGFDDAAPSFFPVREAGGARMTNFTKGLWLQLTVYHVRGT
jgi:hypothetical protein